MSVNQTLNATKMLGALELANPVVITSNSGILTLSAASNSFFAEGSEAITSILGDADVTQGIYIVTWNTVRTLIYDENSLILQGRMNRTTAIGDVGVYELTAAGAREIAYSSAANNCCLKQMKVYDTTGIYSFIAPITGRYKVTVVGAGGGGGGARNTSTQVAAGGGGGG